MRKLTGFWKIASATVCITWGIWFIYTALLYGPHIMVNVPLSVGIGLALTFMLFPASKQRSPKNKPSYLDIVLIIASLVPCVWVMLHYYEFLYHPLSQTPIDSIFSWILFFLLVEASRRSLGWVAPILAIFFLSYTLFLGNILPGRWWFGAADPGFIMGARLFRSEIGYWGLLPRVVVVTIALFMFLGPVLFATRTGDSFMKIARLVSGRVRGGAAQTAVVASALFGMISGSATANVATTGMFTIPTMKSVGYRPEFAGAVEAAASNGGNIMPPIMGAAAFLMAEFLGIPYLMIVVAAVVPAFLYFSGVGAAVYFEACKHGLGRLPSELLPRPREVLNFLSLACIIGPIGLLLALLIIGYTPQFSAVWAFILAIVIHLLLGGRFAWAEVKERIAVIGRGMVNGAQTLAWLLVLITLLQVVISLIFFTGVAVQFSDVISSIGRESLFPALLITAVIAMILGTGMPTTAAYVICVAVLAPALIKLGMSPLAAHMFIFYYAILAQITPPVCTAVFAGAAIAGAKWMPTALIAIRLGVGAYVVPFALAYDPGIMLKGEPLIILVAVITAFVSIVCVSAAGMGYFIKPLSIFERIVLLAGGLCLLTPIPIFDGLGIALLGIAIASQRFMPRIPILGRR